MPQKYLYPTDLAPLLRQIWEQPLPRWEGKRWKLPADRALRELLSIVYNTSLQQEEGRQLSFCVINISEESAKTNTQLRFSGYRIVSFETTRRCTAEELRRLSPAAEPKRSMIAVALNSRREWEIWGLIDSGTHLWEAAHHGDVDEVRPPPPALVMASEGPGHLRFSCASEDVLALKHGEVHYPERGIFWAGPLATFLNPARRRFQNEVNAPRRRERPYIEDQEYPSRFYTFCLMRVLQGIQERRHGATVILLPEADAGQAPSLPDLSIKYSCDYPHAWPLMVKKLQLDHACTLFVLDVLSKQDAVALSRTREYILADTERREASEQLYDALDFIASLSAVDGALVLTRRLEVIGFGAEVRANTSALSNIQLASSSSPHLQEAPINQFGTRHRSAFRFCAENRQAVAFVISRDGGVKVVKGQRNSVIVWPDLDIEG